MRTPVIAIIPICLIFSPARAGCLEELQNVINKHVNSGAYRVEMKIEADHPMLITAEVIMPDKFHMVMPQGEAVIIGDHTWMKMGGKWMEIPGMGKTIGGLTKQAELSSAASAQNLTCSDADHEGKSYRLFEFDASGKTMGINAKTHVKLYADAGTSLPAYQEIEGESLGKKSSMSQTFTFDPSITIEPPK